MAQSTISELQKMLGDALSGVSSDTLQFYMDQSYIIVQNEGVSVSHYKFSIMQLYKTAHLLFTNGFLKGDVMSEAVADVSVSYGGAGAAGVDGKYTSKWERLYQQVRVTVLGLTDRIL